MSEPRRKSPTGRLVVYGVFWSFAAWVVVSIVGSMAVTLYGPPPASGAEGQYSKQQRAWCLRALSGLRDDLEAEVTHELSRAATEPAPLRRWKTFEEHWLHTLEDATARCAQGHGEIMAKGYEQVRRLHGAYAPSVVQVIESRAELRAELAESLRQLQAGR